MTHWKRVRTKPFNLEYIPSHCHFCHLPRKKSPQSSYPSTLARQTPGPSCFHHQDPSNLICKACPSGMYSTQLQDQKGAAKNWEWSFLFHSQPKLPGSDAVWIEGRAIKKHPELLTMCFRIWEQKLQTMVWVTSSYFMEYHEPRRIMQHVMLFFKNIPIFEKMIRTPPVSKLHGRTHLHVCALSNRTKSILGSFRGMYLVAVGHRRLKLRLGIPSKVVLWFCGIFPLKHSNF